MRRLLPLLVLLGGAALASVDWDYNPPGLRPDQRGALSTLQKPVVSTAIRPWTAPRPAHDRIAWSAPLAAAAAVDREGRETELPVALGQDLSDPLRLPEDAVALRVWLDGPLTVSVDGRIQRSLALDTLEIPLVEPGAGDVRVELSFGPLSGLGALDEAALARRLEDGALAAPW